MFFNGLGFFKPKTKQTKHGIFQSEKLDPENPFSEPHIDVH